MTNEQTLRYETIIQKRTELRLKKDSNHLGVKKLIGDLEQEIYTFQAETENENQLIILGLQELILRIELNTL